MGNLFARRRLTTVESLEKLDKRILNAEEYRKTTQLGQKRYVAYLIIFSSLLYLLAFVFGYFYYYPLTAWDTVLRLTPLFLFPFLVMFLKVLGCWWFTLRLEANQQQLEKLRRQRREVLDEVKTKEVYVVAKDILEKFEPSCQLERLKMENKLEQERLKEMELRQRHVRNAASISPNTADNGSARDQTSIRSAQVTRLPRPIPPAERSILDKLVDYFLADGPSNRYALICTNCLSHNGMALMPDFETLSYRCVYCGFFNDRRSSHASSSNSIVASSSSKTLPVISASDLDAGVSSLSAALSDGAAASSSETAASSA